MRRGVKTFPLPAHPFFNFPPTSFLVSLISDKPFCKPGQIQVYGVAKREKIRVSCDVISNPSVDLTFEWVFNSSSERLDLQENLIEVRGTRSLAHHMPQVRTISLFFKRSTFFQTIYLSLFF